MDRASLYFMNETDKNTYDFDETLPALPLPELRETMARYVESVKPFATPAELAVTVATVERFERGIGAELQAKLQERAAKMKNWLGTWWEDYAYHLLRLPLLPYQQMSMASQMAVVGAPETPEYALKSLARQTHHSLEFWNLTRKATIKPLTSGGGKIKYSSALYKRFYSTTRVPGIERDYIEKHFRTVNEGKTPTHILVAGKGRNFVFEGVHEDDSILTPQELLIVFQRIRTMLDYEPDGDCVPVLSHDERTTWANNRARLIEISPANKEALKLIESSSLFICFDEHEPRDYEEISQVGLFGDFHSKWGDRSSTFITYKNGKFAWTGEHSCYDGTISVSYVTFIQLSLIECPEPDWQDVEHTKVIALQELKFDLDDKLKAEIQRMRAEIEARGLDITITFDVFNEYGKDFLKKYKLHPDSFAQVVMQWAYQKLHGEIAPTYETALMRHFYNGRTETLRSCTPRVAEFLKLAANTEVTTEAEIVKSFCAAVNDHKYMMDEARKGNGIDRHLFGLWCAAYESKLDIPDFFDDPLYAKSGGGGNFVLSTSTLGFTLNVGHVAPMMLDGYGVFYSITSECFFINTTAYRDSLKTSARKFNQAFKTTFHEIGALLDKMGGAKL